MKAIFGISGIHYSSWDFWDFSFKLWDFWDFSMLFKILGFGISILAAGILGFYQSQKPFLGFFIQIVRNFWRYAPFFPVLEICFTCFVVSMLAKTYQLWTRKGMGYSSILLAHLENFLPSAWLQIFTCPFIRPRIRKISTIKSYLPPPKTCLKFSPPLFDASKFFFDSPYITC